MDLLFGGGVTKAYVPTAITPTLDLDAALHTYTDSGTTTCVHGDPVKTWRDIRKVAGDYGTSGDFIQDTQVKRPIYRQNVFGTRPGIEFKTDDLLTCTGADVAGRLTDTTFSLFVVCKFHLGSTATQVMLSMAHSTALNCQYRLANYLGTTWAFWRTDDAGTQTSLTKGGADSAAHLLTIIVNGSTASMWVRSRGSVAASGDAADSTTGSFGTTAITSYDNMTLGALKYNNTEGTFADFYLGRVVLYNSVLSSSQRADVENDLIKLYL